MRDDLIMGWVLGAIFGFVGGLLLSSYVFDVQTERRIAKGFFGFDGKLYRIERLVQ